MLHITSLPSNCGIGDFGTWAYNFAGLLARAGQAYWQVLPLNPTSPETGNSPYTSTSSFAINPLFVSLEGMKEDGLLGERAYGFGNAQEASKANYEEAGLLKREILKDAYSNFKRDPSDLSGDFDRFCADNSWWLEDFALFTALKEATGQPWFGWRADLRKREKEALERASRTLETGFIKFAQFIAYRQWFRLRQFCKGLGLSIFGDLPFYVAHDSSDVWANQELFKLDAEGRALYVSGVPPDYFSRTGQLWGHPVYDWGKMEEAGFEWWMRRIGHSLKLFDLLRIDHFRGLLAYWEVPSSERTAVRGKWVKAPSEGFFSRLKERFPGLPFVAEDLGVITEDVKGAMNALGLPGMRVLIFAFDGDPDNPHLPENHIENSVVYTGTHDTNTVRGWFNEEASEATRENLYRHLGKKVGEDAVSMEFIRLAMNSVSRLCIVPLQDILNLGGEARLNNPASPHNNYLWRATREMITDEAFIEFSELTYESGRSNK